MRRFLFRFSIFLLVVYACLCGAMFAVQRSLIYYPVKNSHRGEANTAIMKVNQQEIVIAFRNGSASALLEPAAASRPDASLVATVEQLSASRQTAIIYFGGNAEDVSHSLSQLEQAFPSAPIYAMHYRGFGGSSGTPTQEGLFDDALQMFDRLKRRYSQVVLIGRSLGTGVATYVASQREVKQLILVTPYYSLERVAQHQYPYLPVSLLLLDKFESYQYAPRVKAPVLMVVAEWDQLTPPEGSRELQARFVPGQVRTIVIKQAWHNGISNSPDYVPALQSAW